MVRLQPRGLIADHGIGGGVGFVEPVIRKLLKKIENFAGFFLVYPVFRSAFFKLWTFRIHCLFDLFTHGPAQQISTTKAIARHNLRDLHHLFLINDDALGFFQYVVDQRVNGFAFFDAILDLTIGRNVLHWPRSIQRHKGDDVFDTGRFHPLERVDHARAFHLKHGDRFASGIEFVRSFIIQRDRVDLVHRPVCWLV